MLLYIASSGQWAEVIEAHQEAFEFKGRQCLPGAVLFSYDLSRHGAAKVSYKSWEALEAEIFTDQLAEISAKASC